MLITVWVDDLLIFAEMNDDLEAIKSQLKELCEITDMGESKKIIGIEIERNRSNGSISLSQE